MVVCGVFLPYFAKCLHKAFAKGYAHIFVVSEKLSNVTSTLPWISAPISRTANPPFSTVHTASAVFVSDAEGGLSPSR